MITIRLASMFIEKGMKFTSDQFRSALDNIILNTKAIYFALSKVDARVQRLEEATKLRPRFPYIVDVVVTVATAADTGDATTQCAFHYDVYTHNKAGDSDFLIASDVIPAYNRPAIGALVAADVGIGMSMEKAVPDGQEEFVLIYTDEVLDTEAC